MLNIIIYTLCGLGIGFSLGMLAVAVLVDRRTKKRKRELARFIGARGNGKTGCSTINPYCYIDQEEPYCYYDQEEEGGLKDEF